MSGGSYNYLCHAGDLDGLWAKRGSLDEMAERLAGLGYARDAALETEELVTLLRQWDVRATARISRLAGVWKAIEWWDSCDYGEDDVRETLAQYREDHPVAVRPQDEAKPKPASLLRTHAVTLDTGAVEVVEAETSFDDGQWLHLFVGDHETVFSAPRHRVVGIRVTPTILLARTYRERAEVQPPDDAAVLNRLADNIDPDSRSVS